MQQLQCKTHLRAKADVMAAMDEISDKSVAFADEVEGGEEVMEPSAAAPLENKATRSDFCAAYQFRDTVRYTIAAAILVTRSSQNTVRAPKAPRS